MKENLGGSDVNAGALRVATPSGSAPSAGVVQVTSIPGITIATNYATLNDAVTAALAASKVLYIPAGNYTITSAMVFDDITNLHIFGAGSGVAQIWLSGNINAFEFTGVCTDVTIDGLSIIHGTAASSGYGISVIGTSGIHSDSFILRDLLLQNIPYPMYFQYLDRCFISSIRYVQSLTSATLGDMVYLQNCISFRIRDWMTTVTAGTIAGNGFLIDSDCDTILLDGVEVGATDASGVKCANSLGGGHTGPRLVRLQNCYSESHAVAGYWIAAGRDVRLSGCHAAMNSATGFSVSGGDSIIFDNCLALQNDLHGFYIEGGTGVSVENCTASNNSQAAHNTYDGIAVAAASTGGCRVIGNRSGDFIYSLTNKQYAGIVLVDGADNLIVMNNDLRGNQTYSLYDGTTTTNKIIGANLPANAAYTVSNSSTDRT